MAVEKIYTAGYRGPLTAFHYLPPGEYRVGDKLDVGKRVVTEELARYMVSIGMAVGRADFDSDDDAGGHGVATKIVGVKKDGGVDATPRTVKRGRGRRTTK